MFVSAAVRGTKFPEWFVQGRDLMVDSQLLKTKSLSVTIVAHHDKSGQRDQHRGLVQVESNFIKQRVLAFLAATSPQTETSSYTGAATSSELQDLSRTQGLDVIFHEKVVLSQYIHTGLNFFDPPE